MMSQRSLCLRHSEDLLMKPNISTLIKNDAKEKDMILLYGIEKKSNWVDLFFDEQLFLN